MRKQSSGAVLLAAALCLTVAAPPASAQALGTDITYTGDADFDQGTLVSVNHDAPLNNQLQLDSPTEPFPFINVAASGRGTVVRVNTDTGHVVGEYRTAPEGRGLDPSRTTVDLFGSVWTANRGEVGEIGGVPHGSAVKIGLIVGGTRTDEAGSADPTGGYLAPPFGYSTCVDRDGDGLIRTSMGLHDVLAWPDVSDGSGGPDGLVQDAVDECILVYQRLPDAEQTRHVSVDADNNVWVGGYPFQQRMFYKLDGSTGATLDSFDARDFGCGGYGGLVDGQGVLWSVGGGTAEGSLLRYDPATKTASCINTYGGYGLGIDANGYVWTSIWENGIAKVSPGGVLEPGYPKSTWPASSTATGVVRPTVAGAASPLLVAPPPQRDPVRPAAQANRLAELAVPVPKAPVPARQPLLPPSELDPQADLTDPSFQVAPHDDWVGSQNPWTPGATITLTIADGGGVLYTATQTADPSGNFNFNLGDGFDIERGQVVTVSDGTTTKTHTVMDLYVDGVNVAADTVSGRAGAGSAVDVWVHGDGNVTVTADGSGHWTADFSGMTDLTYASDGGSQQLDTDGDSTGVWWASPRFQVAPDDDWVGSQTRWTPGSTITLTIADGGGVLYTASQTADPSGNFNFELWDVFDIQRGQVVTVSDGTTTKVHVVTDVAVTEIDAAADTIIGIAEPDAWVQVDAGLFADWSTREVRADHTGVWTANFSLPQGEQPPLEINGATTINVAEFDDDGDSTTRRFGPPVQANRGVAVTPTDNHVWLANSGVGTVTRLDNDGNIVQVIETGTMPTGVAVDAAGKVWVTNLGSDNTVRIDPGAGTDGLGGVDLTVDLGPGASPYNYSDMTGAVVVGSTSPQGFWTVIQDSGEAGFEWGRLTWNTEPEAKEPAGTEIVVETRTSNSEAGLGGATFIRVSNGGLFSSFGRYIEVRVTLKASPEGLSPVLSDIRVQPAIIEVDLDIKPGSYPNSIRLASIGVIPVAVLGSAAFDVTTIDVATLRFGPDLAMPTHNLADPKVYRGHLQDVNKDGRMDLLSHYLVGDTGLADDDTEACLIGETVAGIPIRGCDSVRMLGKP